MGEPLPEQVLDTAANPDEIVDQSFAVRRKGFDPQQVQQYLTAIAASLRDAQQRESEMRSRLGRAVRRAEAAEQALRAAPSTDPSDVTRQLGDDVASVLDAARSASQRKLEAAEASADKLVAQAKSESAAEAQQIRDQARDEAKAMVDDAAERVERACAECDALIGEAEEARAQILEDMERRRRQARAQVERLRVGRDRMLRSYDVVRRTMEETTIELKSSLKEAKVRGDGAARAVVAEPLASRDQLEAELRDAKMIGRITISEPTPPKRESQPAAPTSLTSKALPRPLDKPPSQSADASSRPKAPAVAPALTASTGQAPEDPIAAMMAAAEAKQAGTAAPVSAQPDEEEHGPVDDELAQLEDDNLTVVEPSDDIEEVVAVPMAADDDEPALGLFDALRAQRAPKDTKKATGKKKAKTKAASKKTQDKTAAAKKTKVEQAEAKPAAKKSKVEKAKEVLKSPTSTAVIPGIEAQRDAVIADAAKQLEKRLKRALADEQNDVLAGIRAAKKRVELTTIVGDVDTHINRYVTAIHEVAAVTYGAGAALLDVEAPEGRLPAGAVEELLESDVVSPIRARLESLDDMRVEVADMHVDPVRAFYRQRKTDHLGDAASRLANLLCVAGVCDALPQESALPWAVSTK